MKNRSDLPFFTSRKVFLVLRGGLGNQLHQIAASVAIAEKHEATVVIFPHIVDTALDTTRRGYFRDFNLTGIFPSAPIREATAFESVLIRTLLKIGLRRLRKFWILEENFFSFKARNFMFIQGWFQSFLHLPSLVEFQAFQLNGDSRHESTAIHVRLTDFKNIDPDPLTQNYYKNALRVIAKKGVEIDSYSDDIEGAKIMLSGLGSFNYPESESFMSPSELLRRIGSSKNLICSRSSLCWWAANLVSSRGGLVISPWKDSAHNPQWVSID